MHHGAKLTIDDLCFDVRLGVPDAERAEPQTVVVTMVFEFDAPPGAATTDAIDATIDYGTLIRSLKQAIVSLEIKTIERLAQIVLDHVVSLVSGGCDGVTITVRKFPPIEGLRGGAAFTLGWANGS